MSEAEAVARQPSSQGFETRAAIGKPMAVVAREPRSKRREAVERRRFEDTVLRRIDPRFCHQRESGRHLRSWQA